MRTWNALAPFVDAPVWTPPLSAEEVVLTFTSPYTIEPFAYEGGGSAESVWLGKLSVVAWNATSVRVTFAFRPRPLFDRLKHYRIRVPSTLRPLLREVSDASVEEP